ncbi:hypothetical protein WN943_015486 [Citrus x changshan-huyou]
MSFDGSKGIEKTIFLAIACFYEGKYRDYVKKFSNTVILKPIVGIETDVVEVIIFDRFSHKEMHFDGTDIRELSFATELLFGLVQLTLNGCKNLERLPMTISALKYLSTLNLSGLLKFSEFPEKTSNRDQLLEIHLEGTAIRELPASIELFFWQCLVEFERLQESQ